MDFRKAASSSFDVLEDGAVLALSMYVKMGWFEIASYANEEIDFEEEWDMKVAQEVREEASIERVLREVGFSEVKLEREVVAFPMNAERLRRMVAGYVTGTNIIARSLFAMYPREKLDRAIDLIVATAVKENGPEFELSGIIQFVVAKSKIKGTPTRERIALLPLAGAEHSP